MKYVLYDHNQKYITFQSSRIRANAAAKYELEQNGAPFVNIFGFEDMHPMPPPFASSGVHIRTVYPENAEMYTDLGELKISNVDELIENRDHFKGQVARQIKTISDLRIERDNAQALTYEWADRTKKAELERDQFAEKLRLREGEKAALVAEVESHQQVMNTHVLQHRNEVERLAKERDQAKQLADKQRSLMQTLREQEGDRNERAEDWLVAIEELGKRLRQLQSLDKTRDQKVADADAARCIAENRFANIQEYLRILVERATDLDQAKSIARKAQEI